MAEPALSLRALTKTFGGLRVSDAVSLDIMDGEIHALIGPNGAGKTTLLQQISGFLAPDSGSILLSGRDITHVSAEGRARLGLARTFQITSIFPAFSALESVALAVQSRAGSSFRLFRPVAREQALNEQAHALLQRVGLASRADVPAASLSHGEKRALECAMALALQPRILVLDEPMAGAGHDEGERLIELMASMRGGITLLLVEHDMDAVFKLADRITVLVNGQVIASGRPDAIRADPAVRAAYLGDEVL